MMAAVVTEDKAVKEQGGRQGDPRVDKAEGKHGAEKSEDVSRKNRLSVSASTRRSLPDGVFRSAVTRLLCGLYALALVVVGLVLAVASSLFRTPTIHLHCLEVFLLYLYLGTVATLLYLQFCVLGGKQVRNPSRNSSIRIVIRRSQGDHHLSPLTSILVVPSLSPNEKVVNEPEFEPGTGSGMHRHRWSALSNASDFRSNVSDFRLSNASDFRSNVSDFQSLLVAPSFGGEAHVGEGINFYLRLGALGFSFGSVTMDGLHLASYWEPGSSMCRSPLFICLHVAHLLFTFMQTFFLFKNHKLVMSKNKAWVRLSLMHLLATNMCVWLVTVVRETAQDYWHQDYLSASADPENGTVLPSLSLASKNCYSGELTLARWASPYLFPCTVIYSLVAAGLMYRLYGQVGLRVPRRRCHSHASFTSCGAPKGMVFTDCEKAHKGLFSGLLVAVVTLIAIATFFVLDTHMNSTEAAKVLFLLNIALLLLTGAGTLTGIRQFQKLRFFLNTPDPSCCSSSSASLLSLDSTLLLMTLGCGVYLYLGFRFVSSASSFLTGSQGEIQGAWKDVEVGVRVLSVGSILLEFVQATLQVVFVVDGLCRRARSDSQVESKPGRTALTFVLVCNLAQWLVTLFETHHTMILPFHMAFYGALSWNVILHVCVPLYVYFRFHSAICLSKIWYTAYTKGD